MSLDSDRKPPITPQLAIRIAIIGGAALVMFGVIFFRLWYMQVLSGDRYLAEANNNRVREINVEAPRGKIVDRNGRLLVGNRTGYAIQITKEELKDKRYRGVKQGDRVGQSGIEYSYDRYLRGVDGATRLQVDARGTLRGELAVKNPKPGQQLRLGVDLDVEKTAQQAMGGAKGGFVVMDVDTGEVRALGSYPSFDPNIFSKVLKESDYTRLRDPNPGAPLSNRPIQIPYPTAPTIKLITAD